MLFKFFGLELLLIVCLMSIFLFIECEYVKEKVIFLGASLFASVGTIGKHTFVVLKYFTLVKQLILPTF